MGEKEKEKKKKRERKEKKRERKETERKRTERTEIVVDRVEWSSVIKGVRMHRAYASCVCIVRMHCECVL